MKNIPIIILHGWNLSADKYQLLQSELERKGFKVYTVDLPGFGKTKILSHTFTIMDYGDYVLHYLKKKKLDKVIILGHSFGGRIGIYLSVNYPGFVEAVILSGTPGLGKDLTAKEKTYLLLAKFGKILFSVPVLSVFADFARKILYRMVGSYDYYKTTGTLRETFQNVVAYRLEPLLDKINCPTLLIWGTEDKIVPVKVSHGMNRLIKNSKIVVINGARHGIPWTHSERFADEVEKFLESI